MLGSDEILARAPSEGQCQERTSLQKPWAAGHLEVSFWHAAIIFLQTGQPAGGGGRGSGVSGSPRASRGLWKKRTKPGLPFMTLYCSLVRTGEPSFFWAQV